MGGLRLNPTSNPADYFVEPSDAIATFAMSVGADPHKLHRFWRAPRKNGQDRYERVLLATLELAREGGYEAVQMRDVAHVSGVSMASIYTYFGSRDNLAYRAAIVWAALMTSKAKSTIAEAVAGIEDPHSRTLARFETQVAAMWSEPNMLALLVRSTMTDDPDVVAAQRGAHWGYWLEENPLQSTTTAEELKDFLELVQDVFYARAVRWVFGQQDLEDVLSSVRKAGRHLHPTRGDSTSA